MCAPCVVLCEDCDIFIAPLCCGVWRLCFFHIPIHMCGPCVVMCEDFEILKVPLCGPCVVLCEDVEIFIVPTVCESCVVMCEDFDFYKVPLCEKLEVLSWRDSVFHTYRDFPLILERLFFRFLPCGGAVRP